MTEIAPHLEQVVLALASVAGATTACAAHGDFVHGPARSVRRPMRPGSPH